MLLIYRTPRSRRRTARRRPTPGGRSWFAYTRGLREDGSLVERRRRSRASTGDHRAGPRRARRSSPTGRSPRPRSTSAATTSSTCPTSTAPLELGAKRMPNIGDGPVEVRPVWRSRGAPAEPDARVERAFREESGRGPGDAHPPRSAATSSSPRTRCRTPSPPRWPTWPRDGVPRPPRRVAHRDRPAQGDRPPAPRAHARRPRRAPWSSCMDARAQPGGAGRRRAGRRRRRPPAADLHLLPPRAGARGPRGADAAHPRRPHHGGDRARLPRPRADDGAAPRARQAQDRRRPDPLPRAARRRAPRPAGRRAARRLPRLQRGLLGLGRRRPRPRELCDEAIRLGRLLAGAHARRPRGTSGCWRSCCCTTPGAQRGSTPTGASSRLDEQDRGRWDRARIAEGRAALDAALRLRPPGPVPAAGGDRRAARGGGASAADTDWAPIARALQRAGRRGAVAGGRRQPRGRGRPGRGTATAAWRCWTASLADEPAGRPTPRCTPRTRSSCARAGDRAARRRRVRGARSPRAPTPWSATSSSAGALSWRRRRRPTGSARRSAPPTPPTAAGPRPRRVRRRCGPPAAGARGPRTGPSGPK